MPTLIMHIAGGVAAAFPQATHSAPRPEVPQHAGGSPLESQGYGLQPQQNGQDGFKQRLSDLSVGQQP